MTILDRGEFGKGCSHGNCGYVCPSHVLPLATPGAILTTLKAMLGPRAPLRIKPRLDLALFSWLWNFARHCNRHDMALSAQAIQALLNSSRRLYNEWMADRGIDCEWQTQGLLFVFRSSEAMSHYGETDQLLARDYAMPARRYGSEELARLEPALKPGLAGGWLYESDAHLRPDRLMVSLRKSLLAAGVEIRENCGMIRILHRRGRALALETTHGPIPGDKFIIATGAWTAQLQDLLGCRIPIQPGKGYSITMPRPALCPTYPLIFEEDRVAITPMASGYRIGSTMEFAGFDSSLNRKRLELLKDGARRYLHDPFGEPVQEEWFGWRPMTSDSRPIIGPVPRYGNMLLAAGHNMLGLSMAPATGKLVAELAGGHPPHLDPEPYSVTRFN